jgi:alpha-L-rhamnosidase
MHEIGHSIYKNYMQKGVNDMEEKRFPRSFIRTGKEFSTKESGVAAPLFRKKFLITPEIREKICHAKIIIGACGFYEIYFNGANMTKGILAPYISALDDLVYYDEIVVTDSILVGENLIGIWLGNGFMNNPGGSPWSFEKAPWRGAPSFAMELHISLTDGETICICSDESFVTAPSPILFDDYRIGEVYDARMEKEGWNLPEYDDKEWKKAEPAPTPRGEAVLCTAEPVKQIGEYKPVKITKLEGGCLFDFGMNSAGVSRLKIEGKPGQKIVLHHGEDLQDGKLNLRNTTCDPNMETNVDVYICRGGVEEYQTRFAYHGFQYVYAEGLTEDQISEDTITYIEMHSDIRERGGFSCSMERANRIQEATRRSTTSNF